MSENKIVAKSQHVVARSEQIVDLGPGVSFQVTKDGRLWSAFIIRYQGQAYCYLNACAHAGLKLNRDSDEYFGHKGSSLICRAHGAIYDADTGKCTGGPCVGYSLIALAITEKNGSIYYEDEKYELAK